MRAIETAQALSESRLIDRLLWRRSWIWVLGVLLIGIVGLNVSLLKLNSGIGVTAQRSQALKRQNGELRAQVSRLSNSERVMARASAAGYLLPAPSQVTYLRTDRKAPHGGSAPPDQPGRGTASGEQPLYSDSPPEPATPNQAGQSSGIP